MTRQTRTNKPGNKTEKTFKEQIGEGKLRKQKTNKIEI